MGMACQQQLLLESEIQLFRTVLLLLPIRESLTGFKTPINHIDVLLVEKGY